MIDVIWTYRVKPENKIEFEKRYASDGEWAQLFRLAAGYRGTTLLRDLEAENRYATLDRWDSVAAFEAFQRDFSSEYAKLDGECSSFTLEESRVGVFQS
jgi:heme-degrading monooxygenase HmoA